MSTQLKGQRIAVLATDGFEKVELTIPVAALRSAGAEVDIVSLRRGSIRGVNLHKPANKVEVDKTVKEADPDDYDGLLIPGGFINPDILRQSVEARDFVRAFDSADKPIASLCHRPLGARVCGTSGGTRRNQLAGSSRRHGECRRQVARQGSGLGRKPGHEPWSARPRALCARVAEALCSRCFSG